MGRKVEEYRNGRQDFSDQLDQYLRVGGTDLWVKVISDMTGFIPEVIERFGYTHKKPRSRSDWQSVIEGAVYALSIRGISPQEIRPYQITNEGFLNENLLSSPKKSHHSGETYWQSEYS